MRKVLFEVPDISQYQGNVNFKAVKDAGYPQIYLRAGYGKNNTDQKYQQNAQACYNLNMPVMIYWFSYALNAEMAAREAEYAIAHARKYWQTCPIAYDLEYDTRRYAATQGVNIDKKLATDMAIAFLNRVKAEGFKPVLYANRDYLNNYFDVNRINSALGIDVDIWFAFYSNSEPAEASKIKIWQYTSKGSIPGISGNVDINKVYDDIFGSVVKTEVKQTCNLRIMDFQKSANLDGYRDINGKRLDEDGIDGKNTQFVRRKVNLKAGNLGRVGSKGYLVRWLQKRLNEVCNAGLVVDGQFGAGTRKAVVAFQKSNANGLTVDGIAGYNTIQMLFYK